ncbi:hypothetical protein AN958_06361 [Leucoagaricus sp. SymC.cos]|nr:hypothetical protein AN958_06361 [Leucoagaricus sp. SymC.cos]
MPTRDAKYYFEDGSCVFKVGDYLFKIHCSLLTQESEFFDKMFTLPQPKQEIRKEHNGAHGGEGSSDENPIRCQDSVEAFRALCWGLYARPAEVRAQDDPNKVDLDRLVLLADIAHKYECGSLESWANDVIRGHWSSDFGPSTTGASYDGVWTREIMEKLLILTIRTDIVDSTFKKQVETQWLSLAFANSDKPSDLRRALDFADKLDSSRHQGLAYYHALRRLGVVSTASPASTDFTEIIQKPSNLSKDLMCALNTEQRLRLMKGLWCLDSLRCHSLVNTAFEDRCSECYSISTHKQNCQSLWKRFWSGFNGFNDFGKLLEAALERASGRSDWGSSAPCWRLVKPRVEDMVRRFEEHLPTYFAMP